MAHHVWQRRIPAAGYRLVALSLLFLFLFLLGGCSLSSEPHQAALPPGLAAQALDAALGKLGAPYLLGGQGPAQFDCSGLIVWSYQQAYPSLTLSDGVRAVSDASADALWRFNVERIAPRDMRPGDLVFLTISDSYVTHAGLYIRSLAGGMIEIVDASSFLGQVVREDWPLTGTKRGMWLVGAGRLKTMVSR